MIIVTGAAGFIGSALVWELNQRGIKDIICVDTFQKDARWKNLLKREFTEFVMKDALFSFLQTPEAVDKVEAVIHLGANSSTTEADVDSLIKENYYFSQYLFRWCSDKRKTFIYASSAATYGAGDLGYDDSTDPKDLKPLNAYGYSKVLFDRWALKQKHTPPRWFGLKFFNVFGPNEYHKGPMSSVAYHAFHQIQSSKSIKLFKSYNPKYRDGEQMRDFVYVKDCTRWMYELLSQKAPNGVYNMGFGKARTWLDLGKAAFKASALPENFEWIEMPDNLKGQYQYFTEATMARLMEAGLSQPEWPLELAVADYYQNYLLKKDPYL